jgi:hypothetical protein
MFHGWMFEPDGDQPAADRHRNGEAGQALAVHGRRNGVIEVVTLGAMFA